MVQYHSGMSIDIFLSAQIVKHKAGERQGCFKQGGGLEGGVLKSTSMILNILYSSGQIKEG